MNSLFSKRVENIEKESNDLADKLFIEIREEFKKKDYTVDLEEQIDIFDVSEAVNFRLDGDLISLEILECELAFKVLFQDYEERLEPFFRAAIIQLFTRKLSQTHRFKRLKRRKGNAEPDAPPLIDQLRSSVSSIFKYWNYCLDVVFEFLQENSNFKNSELPADQITQISIILMDSFLGGAQREATNANWEILFKLMKETIEFTEIQFRKIPKGEKLEAFYRLVFCSVSRPFFQPRCGIEKDAQNIANETNLEIFIAGLGYIAENHRKEDLVYDHPIFSHPRTKIELYVKELASSCPNLKEKFFQKRTVKNSRGIEVTVNDLWFEVMMDRTKLDPLLQIGLYVRGQRDGLDLDIPLLRTIYGI